MNSVQQDSKLEFTLYWSVIFLNHIYKLTHYSINQINSEIQQLCTNTFPIAVSFCKKNIVQDIGQQMSLVSNHC